MILIHSGNEAISSQADENQFPKVKGLCQQSLVTNMENIKRAPDCNCSMAELRLRQTDPPQRVRNYRILG